MILPLAAVSYVFRVAIEPFWHATTFLQTTGANRSIGLNLLKAFVAGSWDVTPQFGPRHAVMPTLASPM